MPHSHYTFEITTYKPKTIQLAALIGRELDHGAVHVVDANNSFPLFAITSWAKRKGLDPQHVLEQIFIRRSFTAYQAVATIEDLLRQPPRNVMVLGLLDAFHDEQVQNKAGENLFLRGVRLLKKLQRNTELLTFVENDCEHEHWQKLNNYFGDQIWAAPSLQ